MRSLGSWSPRVPWPVIHLGCTSPKRDFRVKRHVKRIIEENGQQHQRSSKILKHVNNEDLGQFAKPESNKKVQRPRSLDKSSSEELQRRQKSFFRKIQASSDLKYNTQKKAFQSMNEDQDGPEDAKPIFFSSQVPGKADALPAKRHTSSSRVSTGGTTTGEVPTEPKSNHKEAQDPPPKHHKRSRKPPQLSLFEELFPEEAAKQGLNANNVDKQDQEFPRLSLPEMVEDDEAFEDEYVRGRKLSSETAQTASREAYRLWNPSVLVLEVASPSLDESDFRRIAPRGQHIEEWVGPGDFFKVIPARDTHSLQQKTHYWLVFPNPAYARAYQNQVTHLHTLAQTHTPTSIESPIAPPRGMVLKGEEVYKLLQDYALCPPSQQIHILGLFPPLSDRLQRILRHKGYPELTEPHDKTGRAVRFWVEGFLPTLKQIQQFIVQDGRHRGMSWALMNGMDSIQQIDPDGSRAHEEEADEHEGVESEDPGIRGYNRRTKRRWIIAFEDENEARRFVRRWHLRPFSAFDDKEHEHKGDHAPLVHAEYMW